MCIYNYILDLVGLLLKIWFYYINMNAVLETVMCAMLSTVNTCELIIPRYTGITCRMKTKLQITQNKAFNLFYVFHLCHTLV